MPLALLFLSAVLFLAWQRQKQHEAWLKRYIPPLFPDTVLGVPVRTELIELNTPGRPGIRRNLRFVVIHETANTKPTATAQQHSVFLRSGDSGVTSWHYTVDDHEIYHHIPDDEVAWHAGDSRNNIGGNAQGIGIELCVNQGGDFEKTKDNAARLTAWLLWHYGLPADAVKQHFDCSGKNCPETIRDSGSWQWFMALTKGYYEKLQKEAPSKAPK